MPPAVIEEHTLILICFLMLLGGAFIAGIVLISRKDKLDQDLETPKPWILWLAIAALFIFLTRPTYETPYISAADKVMIQAGLPRSAQHILVDLNDCPKPRIGMTDQVLVLIRSRADDKPTVSGCSRIAERPYIVTKGIEQ